MKKTLSILVLVFIQVAIYATSYCLQGTIGKYPIYMSFEEYDTDDEITDVRYFYTSSLKDIVLSVNLKNKNYIFTFDKEKIELTKTSASSFEGKWTNLISTKSLPISLKNVNIDTIKNPFDNLAMVKKMKEELPYDYIKTSFIKLNRDSTQVYKNKSFVWLNESHCKMSFFRLANGFSKQTLALINPKLDEIHINEILAQLSCSSQWEYNNKGESIEYSVDISYLTENLLGFQIFSSWFCGGAHPDFGTQGYLLDLNNAQSYELEDVVIFDKSATTREKGGFDAYSDYKLIYFAPTIVKLMKEEHHFEKPTDENDCDYTDEENWDFVSWCMTESGIEFTPYFPRASRNCEEAFLIPFEKLRKYKSANFKYEW
jgi:hypothetical protein